jgi:ubiquitin-protein ligase
MAALKRIMKEYKELTIDQPFEDDICTVQTKNDDYFNWQATISGPQGTPYEDGLFFIDIEIPHDYPFKPPKIKFTTSIYHCNINEKGGICLDSIKDRWSPASSIRRVLTEIIELLTHPDPDNPLRAEIAKIYKENPELYNKTAAEYTRKYAQ